jgi:NTP pyrophosphatase (non-canonical NTP hydrolase)
MDVEKIQQQLRTFALEREWNQFHSPKNLATALSVEAAELLEIFQWLTDEQSLAITADDQRMDLVSQEIADVMMYLLRLADVLSINLQQAVDQKMKINAEKYPIEKARGNASKYTDL